MPPDEAKRQRETNSGTSYRIHVSSNRDAGGKHIEKLNCTELGQCSLPSSRQGGGVYHRSPDKIHFLVSYRIPHHITLQRSSQRGRGLSQVTKDLPKSSVSHCAASGALFCPTQTGRRGGHNRRAHQKRLTPTVMSSPSQSSLSLSLLEELTKLPRTGSVLRQQWEIPVWEHPP